MLAGILFHIIKLKTTYCDEIFHYSGWNNICNTPILSVEMGMAAKILRRQEYLPLSCSERTLTTFVWSQDSNAPSETLSAVSGGARLYEIDREIRYVYLAHSHCNRASLAARAWILLVEVLAYFCRIYLRCLLKTCIKKNSIKKMPRHCCLRKLWGYVDLSHHFKIIHK